MTNTELPGKLSSGESRGVFSLGQLFRTSEASTYVHSLQWSVNCGTCSLAGGNRHSPSPVWAPGSVFSILGSISPSSGSFIPGQASAKFSRAPLQISKVLFRCSHLLLFSCLAYSSCLPVSPHTHLCLLNCGFGWALPVCPSPCTTFSTPSW